MLFANELAPPTRFVLLRAGERRVALTVDAVLGVCELGAESLHALPPLAGDAVTHTLQALGALDAELLFVFNSAHILPDEFWQKLVPLQT
jgi:purine-binding chemotaxis protein CheW